MKACWQPQRYCVGKVEVWLLLGYIEQSQTELCNWENCDYNWFVWWRMASGRDPRQNLKPNRTLTAFLHMETEPGSRLWKMCGEQPDVTQTWSGKTLACSHAARSNYNNPPARCVSRPPLVIYWGFLQGEEVMADLLLVFHINYINGVGWEAEMGTDIPRSYTDQSILINNTLMYGNISHPRPWAAWVMMASRNGAVSKTISHKTDRME